MLSSLSNSWIGSAWNGGIKSTHVKVINHHDLLTALKVRVDCNRYKTDYTFTSSIKGTKISKDYNISMDYVVDTSKSFVVIPGGESHSFLVDGEFCYISAYEYDGMFNIPLFINHPIPACPEIYITDGLPKITNKEMLEKYIDKAVIIENDSEFDVEARVDCDEGVLSVESSIDLKVIQAKLTTKQSVFYQVEKQGYTKLSPGEEALFFINTPNDDCFVSAVVYPEGFLLKHSSVTLCKNVRAKMTAILKGDANDDEHVGNKFLGFEYYSYPWQYGANQLGPKFTIEKQSDEPLRLKKQYFMYECTQPRGGTPRSVKYTDCWDCWDDDDDNIVFDFNPTKHKFLKGVMSLALE